MEVEASYYMLIPFRKTSQKIKIIVILTFTLILKLQEAFWIKIPTHVVVPSVSFTYIYINPELKRNMN